LPSLFYVIIAPNCCFIVPLTAFLLRQRNCYYHHYPLRLHQLGPDSVTRFLESSLTFFRVSNDAVLISKQTHTLKQRSLVSATSSLLLSLQFLKLTHASFGQFESSPIVLKSPPISKANYYFQMH